MTTKSSRTSKTAAPAADTVQQIPVALIAPSSTNPRKHFDQGEMNNLAESIHAAGIQVPLLVRLSAVFDDQQTYEIVGGERRWRAATALGLRTVPCIVRTMSDLAARDAQMIENLQRADLSPMEEAEGYSTIIARAAEEGVEITDSELAAKVGKTLAHVRSRRKLLDLIPPARAALAKGYLSFGVALLIAKLQPDEQDRATLRALQQINHQAGSEKLAADALVRLDEAEAEDREFLAQMHPEERAEELADRAEPNLLNEAAMRAWIEEKVLLDLARAPWPLDAPVAGVEAPACLECPKRSGSNAALFAELTAKDDVCTDPECFSAKRRAFVQIAQASAKERGRPLLKLSTKRTRDPIVEGQKSYKWGQWVAADAQDCGAAQRGITKEGRILTVCVDPKCRVHKHDLNSVKGHGGSSGGTGFNYGNRETPEQREAKQNAWLAAELPLRTDIARVLRPKLKGAKLLRELGAALLREGRHYQDVAELRGLLPALKPGARHDWSRTVKLVQEAFTKAKDAELEGWLVDIVLADKVIPNGYLFSEPKRDRAELWDLGKRHGVDCDALAKKAAAAAKPKPDADTKKPKHLSAEQRERIAKGMQKRRARAKDAAAKKKARG